MGLFRRPPHMRTQADWEKLIRKTSSSQKLFALLAEASFEDVMKAIIEKIDDPVILEKIIQQYAYKYARIALERIDKQEDIVRIAERFTYGNGNYTYNKRFTWLDFSHFENHLREKIEKTVQDPVLLNHLAYNALLSPIRYSAIEKIHDDQTLLRIMEEVSDKNIRGCAVGNIKSTELLHRIALTEKDPDVRCTAVSKISDQTFLKEIFLNDDNDEVRRVAYKNITDTPFILNALNSWQQVPENLQYITYDKIKNEDLEKLFRQHSSDEVKRFILDCTTDQDISIRIFEEYYNHATLSLPLIEKIKNKVPFKDYIYRVPFDSALCLMRQFLRDKEYLTDISHQAIDPTIREIAELALRGECLKDWHMDVRTDEANETTCHLCDTRLVKGEARVG